VSLARQVTIIGLDGATLDLIKPWAAAGHLPGFRRILAAGAAGRLRSTIPPITATAWTSFMTGQNPGKHAIYDVVLRQPSSYGVKLASARDRLSPSLWARLSQHRKRVATINVPMTYPPEPINGIMIANVDAPGGGSHFFSPAELYPDFRREVPSYIVDAHRMDHDSLAEGCERMMDAHTRAFDYIRQRERWDVLMVVFSAVDMAQHVFWQAMADHDPTYGDVILGVYRQADAVICRILDDIHDDELVLIVSDHGGGPLRRAVYINRYLRDGDFLQHPPSPARAPARHLKAGASVVRRYLPASALAWLRRRWGGVRDQLTSALVENLCDWDRTRVYSVGACGHIYVNLRGREPQGPVAPGADYERLLRDVSDHLLVLRDPDDGLPVIKSVWRREEVYNGPALPRAPDLILGWRDYTHECEYSLGAPHSPVFEDSIWLDGDATAPMTGCHRPYGVLLAYGAGVHPGPVHGASITDLVPSILHALGLSVPSDMDGVVLHSLFTRSGVVENPRSSPEFLRGPLVKGAGR
jgi:predicted AlkP superfamily phosphohydrolase/phosphomutase